MMTNKIIRRHLKKKNDISVSVACRSFKNKHEMPTLPGLEDWPSDYILSESNIRPAEATPIELGYEIDKLERDIAFEKESKNNIQHEFDTYMKDYQKLEVDYLNRGTEIKNLQAKLDKLEGTEQYSLWLMKQHLQMKEQLAAVEDKGEINNQWR